MTERAPALLPAGIAVLERGWLSSNCIVLHDGTGAALVDSGYASHAEQTLTLVRQICKGRPLDLLVNTHLHSDHCGGNALLQTAYPRLQTLIPPGLAEAVRVWNTEALTYATTGQLCPRFRHDGVLQPGSEVVLAGQHWEIHAAPGHDAHSVILFEPKAGLLISADALWRRGFGVVFQELEGERAFDAVADTLDVIENLRPRVVIPGHGPVFTEVEDAIATARSRLAAMVANPSRHAHHAMKVLLMFKLLELQQTESVFLLSWASATPYFRLVHARWFALHPFEPWVQALIDELVRSGAARRDQDRLSAVPNP